MVVIATLLSGVITRGCVGLRHLHCYPQGTLLATSIGAGRAVTCYRLSTILPFHPSFKHDVLFRLAAYICGQCNNALSFRRLYQVGVSGSMGEASRWSGRAVGSSLMMQVYLDVCMVIFQDLVFW